MLNLYEEYATQEDRENAVLLENADIAVDRAILAYNTLQQMEQLNLRSAESRLVMESGDVDHLIEYYEEAADETKDKKEGLVKKVWNAILGLITKIKEVLFGKGSKTDPNKIVEVDSADVEKHKKAKDVVNKINQVWQKPGVKIASIAIGSIVALLAFKTVSKKKKMKSGQVENMKKEEESWLSKISNGIKGMMNRGDKNSQEELDKASGKDADGNEVKGFHAWVKKFLDFIKGLAGRFKKSTDGVSAVPQNKVDSIDDSDSNYTDPDTGESLYVASAEDLDDSGYDMFGESSADVDEIAELLATL